MGFSSLDAFTNEVSVNNRFWRSDFAKSYNGSTVVAGRWYDLSYWNGVNSMATTLGTYVKNGDFLAGVTDWTLGSANWAYTPATHLVTRTANADVSTITQNTSCTNGVTYSVTYTLTRSAGSITPSLGGTNGTARSSAATFTENIVCGAGAGAAITFTPDATFAGTVDKVIIRRALDFTPCNGSSEQAMYTGGDVSPYTKHIINAGVIGTTSTTVPATLMIADILGVYPLIQTNIATSQTLTNNQTLPRYTDGKGVMAYYCIDATNGANAQNFAMTYTNSATVSGRTLGATVANTASAIQGHISHSGVAANNTGGPFLPLYAGDAGVKSVQSVQFSAASASAGFVNLVLCKPLVTIPVTTAFVTAERDLATQLPSWPRVHDGACLGFLVFAGAVVGAASQWQGYIDFAWGNS